MKAWKTLNWLQKGIILGLIASVLIQVYVIFIEEQPFEWKGILSYTATMCFAFSGMAWLASGKDQNAKTKSE